MATLVYHTGALGDFITTLPALAFWKKRENAKQMALLGKRHIGDLAVDAGIVDEVIDVDSAAVARLFSPEVSPESWKFLTPFSKAIVFADADSPLLKNLHNGHFRSIISQPPFPSDRMLVSDYHLSLFIDPASLPVEEKLPRLVPSQGSIAASLGCIPQRGALAAIHPGSGSRKKNWPFCRFLSVAGQLRDKGFCVVWIKGPAETELPFPERDPIAANLPLPVLAGLLSRCRLFLGNDSGIAHLAAATGCSTIVLFGPSDPALWSPQGRDVRIIYTKHHCAPCHRTSAQDPSCDRSCLSAITVDRVVFTALTEEHRAVTQTRVQAHR